MTTLRHIRISASRTLSDDHTILPTAAVLAAAVHNFAYEYFRMLLSLLHFFPELVIDTRCGRKVMRLISF
jgi:hypothetical protein